MAETLYFDDVTEGSQLPVLVKQPDPRQLVMWAGASGDYNPIHYDRDFAVNRGLNGVIVQGQLVGSFLGQLVTGWMGVEGNLKKFNCSYKGMNYPGEVITCRGEVTQKYVEGDEHCVKLRCWAENPGGEKTVTGQAVVTLPVRG